MKVFFLLGCVWNVNVCPVDNSMADSSSMTNDHMTNKTKSVTKRTARKLIKVSSERRDCLIAMKADV